MLRLQLLFLLHCYSIVCFCELDVNINSYALLFRFEVARMSCGGNSYRWISAARARPQQQTRRPPLLLWIDGTEDRRTLDRLMTLTAYNA